MLAADPEVPSFHAASGLFNSAKNNLGLRRIRGKHVMLYRAEPNGYKFCHHPNFAVFGDKLYLMWSNGLVNEDFPGQRILYCNSSDGAKWTKPIQLTDHKQGKGICVAAGFHVSDGTIIAFYTATGGTNFHPDTALTARTSLDGTSWSEPQRITDGFFIEGPRRLANGRLLVCGEHVGEKRKSNRMRLLYTEQADGLSGWKEARIKLGDLKVFGYTEPNWFQRDDGRVVMAFRNYSGHLFSSTSTDHGDEWTAPVETNFPDTTARFCMGRLPDGTIYLINNSLPKQFDRSLLTIAISKDGKTFDLAFIVRGEPTKMRYQGKSKLDGWQYPHAIVWKGCLHVAYSINKEDVGLTRIDLDDLRGD